MLEPRYLDVLLHDQHIGWLCEAGRTTRFVPTEEYLLDPNRPTLSLSITVPGRNDLTRNILNNHFDPAIYAERGEPPPFFAGLLPEGELRKRLEATRTNPRDRDDVGVLAAAGEDLPGGIKVLPADLRRLTPAGRAYGVTGGADHLAIGVPEQAAEGAASVSGAQDKLALSAARNGKRFVLPMRGKLSDVIAKLPAKGDDAQIFNELACMRLARLAGVNTAECRAEKMSAIQLPQLVEALGADTHFLLVDRFDRTPGGSVHMEDACQALRLMPSQKYAKAESYALFVSLINMLGTRGIEDVRQFFIRQAVNTLVGNSDAHLKNFSLLYHNGIAPELSPAYDVVCVAALPGFRGYAVNVAVDALQRTETLETYKEMAKRARVSPRIAVAAVKSAVEMAHDTWPAMLASGSVPHTVAEIVRNRLATLPLARLLAR